MAWRLGSVALRWNEKTCLFCTFFHVQPKHQNGNIFVDIEGVRPCLSKPSYQAPKWALMVRLTQKERLKSPQNSPILENQAIWVILAILATTAILVILASHFRTRVDTPRKSSTRGLACINETELHLNSAESTPTGSHAKKYTAEGVSFSRAPPWPFHNWFLPAGAQATTTGTHSAAALQRMAGRFARGSWLAGPSCQGNLLYVNYVLVIKHVINVSSFGHSATCELA